MREIIVTYDPRTDRLRRIECGFNKRIAKRSISRFATPAALVSFLIVFFTVQAHAERPGEGAIWLIPGVVYFAVYDIVNHLAKRRAAAARDAAPIRNRPKVTLRIGPAGVNGEGTQVSWEEIPEVMRLNEATLFLTLPNQALVVPDEALPDGVTPEGLLARISEWKTA